MQAMKPMKPGASHVAEGTYHEVGPRGGKIAHGRVVHITKDHDRLPPTSKAGNGWMKD